MTNVTPTISTLLVRMLIDLDKMSPCGLNLIGTRLSTRMREAGALQAVELPLGLVGTARAGASTEVVSGGRRQRLGPFHAAQP